MSSVTQRLVDAGLAHPPKWLANAVCYETIMGSVAYGVSSDTSDMDVYGFAMPPKDIAFPHLAGYIAGFGAQGPKFDQWQEHHIEVPPNTKGLLIGRQYDCQVYNIIKFLDLCMDNNPNIVDSLFTPQRCVLYINAIGQMVKDKRKIFLHKGCYPKFRGYAYSQLHKIDSKAEATGKRKELIDKFGYDVKYSYHVVRLLRECEQILVEHDLDLEKNSEELKAIRRGEWTKDQIKDFFANNSKSLDKLYVDSKIPEKANEQEIKQLLIDCLEHSYGSLGKLGVLHIPDSYEDAIRQIQKIVDKTLR